MKKLLIFLILCFLPWKGSAIECPEPLVCVKMESQVCEEQNLKHLGKDECVECKCPPEQVYTKNGEEKCCEEDLEDGECKCEVWDSNGKCCTEEQLNTLPSGTTECCNDNEEVLNGECCANIQTYKDKEGVEQKKCCPIGEKVFDKTGECGCPRDRRGKRGSLKMTKDGESICCSDGTLWDSNWGGGQYVYFDPAVCGCPENGKLIEFTEYGVIKRQICCKDIKKWDDDKKKYQEFHLMCGCPDEFKRRDWRGREICCKEELPICDPKIGVPITSGFLGACECGCETDDDCNIAPWYPKNIKTRKCENRACVPNLGCYQFDNLTIELEEWNSELKKEDIPKFAEKLKSDLELKVDEHLTLSIHTMECTERFMELGGYVYSDEPMKIHINVDHCCEISEGEWTCEGTVVHENVHSQDYKQPTWSYLRSTIARAFYNILTETNAHAKGDIASLTQSYRLCFDKTKNFQNVCHWYSVSSLCEKCAKLVPYYLKEFNNSEYAKKYHDDPDYFDPDGGCKGQSYNTCQCQGIRLEIERKYVNSYFNRKTYVAGQAVKHAMCGDDSERGTQEDLRKIIEALAECKGWEKPPEEDLTDLPKLLAQLYKEQSKLCMPAEEIAKNANIAKGLKELKTCSIIHDFLEANANADLNNLPTTCEEKCKKVTLTSD